MLYYVYYVNENIYQQIQKSYFGNKLFPNFWLFKKNIKDKITNNDFFHT